MDEVTSGLCTLLRKNLEVKFLDSIEQLESECILKFVFKSKDEVRGLYLEFFGKAMSFCIGNLQSCPHLLSFNNGNLFKRNFYSRIENEGFSNWYRICRFSHSNLKKQTNISMNKMKKIVYSPVVADLFHYGHLQSLKFADSQGDYLICGVLTDKAAEHYKKNLISNFEERKSIISNLSFVDKVIAQDEIDPTSNLKKIHEEYKDAQLILVHGDDWRTIPGEDFVKKISGKVVKHPYYTGLSDFKIINGLLKRYKGKFKNFEEFTKYFDLKDFTYFNPRKIKNTIFSSKADTLRYLKPLLKNSRIEKTFVFTVFDWKEEQEEIISKIKEKFSPSKIVVRSSTISEDADESSMAGCFHSELNVPSDDTKDIEDAVNKVIKSYDDKKSDYLINQILVQPHTTDVAISGVVFTRTIEDNSPYYIINYDDKSGTTDSVTKGMENKTVKISRFCGAKEYPKDFKELMSSVKEIEAIIPDISLDIEFAINKKNEIVIFQVRPIAVNSKLENKHDEKIKKRIGELKQQFKKMSERKSHLAGDENCFGDMPDWNPAEIIGDNPNYLDYSLYDYIITDNAWHQARTSQGYINVNPAKLVVLFGNKPYIDVRNTFNSFIPATISNELREKLIEFYMKKLKDKPELQDKVEFEVLYTCYDFSFDKKSEELLNAGFTKDEVNELKQSLLDLTNNLIINSKKSIEEDMNSVYKMEKLRNEIEETNSSKKSPETYLKEAKRLLDDCKTNGTVQFSRLARLAFIGNIILKSMIKENIIDKNFYDSFMGSIETVAKKMSNDFNLYLNGKMNQEQFLKLYGHLRPGTYDITNVRYDKNPGLLKSQSILGASIDGENKSGFETNDKVYNKISEELKKHKIKIDAAYLFDFIRSAIESRELSKFEFTKSLSNAIELIAEAGKRLGFSKKEISQLDTGSLFNTGGDEKEISKRWKEIIDTKMKERELNDYLMLPPMLFSEKDFDIISYYSPRPNFITQKRIEGQTVDITHSSSDNVSQLKDKIILLENGDPGYDWIFTKNPAGLITKYGGVASHMAIRAAEFKLPAAIGCGEMFDKIKSFQLIVMDCGFKKITPIR